MDRNVDLCSPTSPLSTSSTPILFFYPFRTYTSGRSEGKLVWEELRTEENRGVSEEEVGEKLDRIEEKRSC